MWPLQGRKQFNQFLFKFAARFIFELFTYELEGSAVMILHKRRVDCEFDNFGIGWFGELDNFIVNSHNIVSSDGCNGRCIAFGQRRVLVQNFTERQTFSGQSLQ